MTRCQRQGPVAAGERITLTWGYEDEALVIHAPEHVPVTMTYNGDHMRRKRQDANAVINYLWDGAQAFIETQSQDATLARYTLAPFGYGDLVSQRRSNETRFYHFDAIGSTRALTDSLGPRPTLLVPGGRVARR